MATPRRTLEPHAGLLLVATAELVDPNFAGSVVLLLDADDQGALGVVLNRPTPVPVDDALTGWGSLVAEPEVLFVGGPVSPDGAIAVARVAAAARTPAAFGFRTVLADLGLLDLDTPVEHLAGALTSLRIFAGYAGWGAGQLEEEIAEGSWYVVPAEVGDVFRDDTSTLWRDVLRRQPGELAWHATRPIDASLN